MVHWTKAQHPLAEVSARGCLISSTLVTCRRPLYFTIGSPLCRILFVRNSVPLEEICTSKNAELVELICPQNGSHYTSMVRSPLRGRLPANKCIFAVLDVRFQLENA